MTNNDRINVIVTAIITKPTGTAIPPILSAAVVGPELAAVVVGVAVALVVLGGQPVFAIKEYKYRKIDCVVMNSQIVAVMSGARLVEELSRRDLPTGYMQVASGRGVSKPVANQTVSLVYGLVLSLLSLFLANWIPSLLALLFSR